jgi:nitrilase
MQTLHNALNDLGFSLVPTCLINRKVVVMTTSISGDQTETYLVCVVQAAPVYLDLLKSVEKAQRLIEQAAGGGAKLIAFPELWLPGYPWWIWLDEPGWAGSNGLMQRYEDQAVKMNSEVVGAIAFAAKRHGVHVLMGAAEKDNGRLYIAQWLVNEKGEIKLHRRKLKPGPLELSVFSEGGAQDLSVVDTDLGRVGALACAEHRHPLFKHAMHLQRELVHVAAWPSFALHNIPGMLSADTFLAVTRTYAVEGGCYVLAPCAPVPQDVIELLCDTQAKRERLKVGGGHAQIFAPNGDPMCAPLPAEQEGLLYAQIDPKFSIRARQSFDLTGHSSRSDVSS